MGINLLSAITGAATGFLTAGPAGAAVGGAAGLFSGNGESGAGNLTRSTDPNLPLQQYMDGGYETAQTALNAENLRHNLAMEQQSTQFNEVTDERTEQLREMNTLRDVAMKQREADIAITKEFIKTVKD